MKQFDKFTASHLYCPKCGCAMPTRERLLLVLPDGDLYDYQCTRCGNSLGEKKVTQKDTLKGGILVP